MLGFVEVPEHGGAVFAARGAEGAVRGDGDCVDVASVADVVGLDAAGSELPDLESGELSAKQVLLTIHLLPRTTRQDCHQCIGELFVSWPEGSEVANTYRLQSIL